MAKLAIIGTGFLGASLGLALRPSKLFAEIAGFDRDRDRLLTAKRLGALDTDCRSAATAVEHAAVVIFTVPSGQLQPALQDVAPALTPGAIVTETTLWKQAAIRAAQALPEGVNFIAGRPVVDHAGAGPEQATAAAFRNAIYCLTPGPLASEEAVRAMSSVVTAAGAQPYFLEPSEHDGLTAAGELLPHALLASLLLTLVGDKAWPEAGKLAGDALDRAAALAEALPDGFWLDAAANAPALGRWLETAASALLDLRERLSAEETARLTADWRTAIEAMARWRTGKRQLRESTMPPRDELKPNLFGNVAALGRLPKRS